MVEREGEEIGHVLAYKFGREAKMGEVREILSQFWSSRQLKTWTIYRPLLPDMGYSTIPYQIRISMKLMIGLVQAYTHHTLLYLGILRSIEAYTDLYQGVPK